MAKSNLVKRERFRTVASRRVQKVLDNLESLSKCANRNTYEYSEEGLRKMMKAINEKVAALKLAFSVGRSSNKGSFEFRQFHYEHRMEMGSRSQNERRGRLQ